jgi:23S rRNA pseudouridine1911/1915/1917 synthase
MQREYIALVHGVIRENLGTIDAPIGRSKTDRKKMAVIADGKQAVSHYTVLKRFSQYTLVRVQLVTGRTHQIRVHFAYIKHSVVNDPLYGSGRKHFKQDSQMLHAGYLNLSHPATGERMNFESPLPEYFLTALNELETGR